MRIISTELANAMRTEYEAGRTANAIAAEYGFSKSSTLDAIRRVGGTIRPKYKYTYDESVFSEITEESAYWLGFLTADGSVQNEDGNRTLELCLKADDIGHVYKFRSFIKATHPVSVVEKRTAGKTYKAARLMFRAERLCQVLAPYGIVQNKSLTVEVPDCLKNNRHYWRGLLDGDGSIMINPEAPLHTKSRVHLSLCGNPSTTASFLEFARTQVETTAKPYKHPTTKAHYAALGATPAYVLLQHMYTDCNIYLDRKYEQALDVFKHFPVD